MTPSKRVGLIQTRGIGDVIIAIPIADYYIEQGYEVYWPIDRQFLRAFQNIKPAIHFLPVDAGDGYFYDDPLRMLQVCGCQTIISLYSYLGGPGGARPVFDQRLASVLKFDEYKYAVAGVPFARKWTLDYVRDMAREEDLFARLGINGPYVCVQEEGSNVRLNLNLPQEVTRGHQVVRVMPLTDNPFDWLLTLERAAKLVLLDSCFSNLVDQMNLPNEKYFIVRSPMQFTPVLNNRWQYWFMNQQT